MKVSGGSGAGFVSLLLALALLASLLGCAAPETAPTATAAPSATPALVAAEVTATPTLELPTATATATPEPPTAMNTATSTATATYTPEPPTASPSATAIPSPRPATATPSPRSTPVPPKPTATPAATATARSRASRAFLGYYAPYDASSWNSLQAQAGSLDYVALQVATLDYCGGLSSTEDRTLKSFAKGRGLPVLASLFTSSEPLNHAMLTNPTAAANAVQQIVTYVLEEGYDGIDLDLEAVPAADRQALTAFVAQVSAALRQQGKMVMMAVPAKTREVTTGWAGAYDYAALAPSLDLVVIMSYAYTTPTSAPGSTAPYNWVEQAAAYATSQFPAQKVLLGMAFYGYDWNTTTGGRAKALRFPQAQALSAVYGVGINLDPASRSATFAYTAKPGDAQPYLDSLPPINHDTYSRRPASCSLGPPPQPTSVPRTPAPTVAALQNHTVWLENAAAVSAKLDIAARYGAGAAAWRLGQEDPAVWPLVNAWRR